MFRYQNYQSDCQTIRHVYVLPFSAKATIFCLLVPGFGSSLYPVTSVPAHRSHLSQVQLVATWRVGPRRGRDPAVIWAFSNIFCQIVIDSMSQKYPLALQTLNISLENNYKMKITLQIMSTIQFFAVIFVHLWDGCQSAGSYWIKLLLFIIRYLLWRVLVSLPNCSVQDQWRTYRYNQYNNFSHFFSHPI